MAIDPCQSAAVLEIAGNAGRSLGLSVTVLKASTDSELDRVFADFKTSNIGILIIGTDAFFNGRTKQLASLATMFAVPTIYHYAEFTAAGVAHQAVAALETHTIQPAYTLSGYFTEKARPTCRFNNQNQGGGSSI